LLGGSDHAHVIKNLKQPTRVTNDRSWPLKVPAHDFFTPLNYPRSVLKRQLIIRVLILYRVPGSAHRSMGTSGDGFHPSGSGAPPDDEQGSAGSKFEIKHVKNIKRTSRAGKGRPSCKDQRSSAVFVKKGHPTKMLRDTRMAAN